MSSDVLAVASPGGPASNSGTRGTTNLDQLGSETVVGFQAGTGAVIQVAGSRTVGVFALPSDIGALNGPVLVTSVEDSSSRETTNFASPRQYSYYTTNGPAAAVGPSSLPPEDKRLFDEAELAGAQFAAGRPSVHWLSVTVEVTTYVPGSNVYLVSSSDPIIFASAVVGKDGTATITGGMPLDLLESGPHRLRVVGIRDYGELTVDAAGAIQLSPATVAEIERFDKGTTAIVRIVGANGTGGVHEAVRYVPLREPPPLWLLYLLVDLNILGLALRRSGTWDISRRQLIGAGLFTAGAVAAGWIMWVMLWGELILWVLPLWVLGQILIIKSRPVLWPREVAPAQPILVATAAD